MCNPSVFKAASHFGAFREHSLCREHTCIQLKGIKYFCPDHVILLRCSLSVLKEPFQPTYRACMLLCVCYFSCDNVDSLTVSVRVGGEQRSHNLGVYCGSRRPPMIMSAGGGHRVAGREGGHLQLTFLSTPSLHQSRGFAAAFQFTTGSCEVSSGNCFENFSEFIRNKL